MTKSTSTYWNALDPASWNRWTPIKGLEQTAEEAFIVSGRLQDKAFDLSLEAVHYASRPPRELRR
jgi:hypothetical protein